MAGYIIITIIIITYSLYYYYSKGVTIIIITSIGLGFPQQGCIPDRGSPSDEKCKLDMTKKMG